MARWQCPKHANNHSESLPFPDSFVSTSFKVEAGLVSVSLVEYGTSRWKWITTIGGNPFGSPNVSSQGRSERCGKLGLPDSLVEWGSEVEAGRHGAISQV